jgi:hypothetical protein
MPAPPSGFLRTFFNSKADKTVLLFQLKRDNTFDYVFDALKNSDSHPLISKWIKANIFPKDYANVRSGKYISPSDSLEGELAWTLFPIVKEFQKINQFITTKFEFEKHVLLGNLDQAQQSLITIENTIGVSLWLLENKLLLAELSGGTEANWIELSRQAQLVTDTFVLYLIQQFSKKIEQNITYSRYKDLLLNDLEETELNFKEYILHRLNPIAIKKFSFYTFFLNIESLSSLTDRFLLVQDIACQLMNDRNQVLVKSLISKTTKVESPIFTQLSNELLPKRFKIFTGSEEALLVIDAYTKGLYQQCIEAIPKLLMENPQIVELFDLYVRSNLELQGNFIPTKISSLIDDILENLYQLYKKESDTNKNLEALLKIILVNYSTSWAKQLYALVNFVSGMREISENDQYNLYQYYSMINNPKNPFTSDVAKMQINIHGLSKSGYQNISLAIVKNLQENSQNDILLNSKIPLIKKQLYILRINYNLGHYERVAQLAKDFDPSVMSPFVAEEVLLLEFNSYLKLKDPVNGLQLYVNTYLNAPYKIKRLDSKALLENIRLSGSELFTLIDYPIFYSIAHNDNYERYVAYDDFLSAANLQRPSELISNPNSLRHEKLIYFLRHVCDIEILKYSYHFQSKEEIENERLILLDFLLTNDKKNESIYIKEIAYLTKIAAIKNAIREVNKGRITINVEQLKEAEALNIKEGFNRYVELSKFSKNRNIQGIDINSKQVSQQLLQIEENKTKVIYLNDPGFISFKAVFLEIRDKFLLSKEYGLDGYLSTRIRHGALQNYIRSIFENEKLISQKDSTGSYVDVDYWKNKLGSNEQKTATLHEFFQQVSKEIDDYTENLIKNLIQIKTEKYVKKPEALFDYSFTQQDLGNLYSILNEEVKDHNQFTNAAFLILTTNTERLLTTIRTYFTTTVTQAYVDIIEHFGEKVKDLMGNTIPELNNAVMRCTTNIRREILNISEWFNISNPSSFLELDINTIIETSLQITNRTSPYYKISAQIIIPEDVHVRGTVNLIYITKILFDNIIEHAKLPANDLHIVINVMQSDDEYLHLKFTNNLGPSIDLITLREKLNEVKNKWNNTIQDFTKSDTEGGSGFDKIRRILTFDMRNKSHFFNFELSEKTISITITLKVTVTNG